MKSNRPKNATTPTADAGLVECVITRSAWFKALKAFITKKPVTILRLRDTTWNALRESRFGVNEFTIALPHGDFEKVQAPTLCLLLAAGARKHHAYLGLLGSHSAVTTLQSRVKVRRAISINPATPDAIVRLLKTSAHQRMLRKRLAEDGEITVLSPKVSEHLIERLATVDTNIGAMQALAASLPLPRYYRGNQELQEDAVRTALKAFGIGSNDRAVSLELMRDGESALARVPVVEDGVIEHDARIVPGYQLIASDLTGRAMFERGNDRLEVFTANRRQLELAFGVDLIYLNVTRQNLVMLQYKLQEELQRMRKFAIVNAPGAYEYRLNPSVFYLKFVKRDGALHQGGIILPIDHYDRVVGNPASRGPRGGLRISYEALGGRYMREQPFLDLIRGGYIGSHAETTEHLMTLVRAVLDRGRGIVAAIQTMTASSGTTGVVTEHDQRGEDSDE
jgi:hypothetical protein